MIHDKVRTGVRTLAGLVAITLCASYCAHSARLQRQVETLERQQQIDAARMRTVIDRVLVDASERVRAVQGQLVQLSDAVESTRETDRAEIDRVLRDARAGEDPRTLSNQLLAPSVQISGRDHVGSGTLVCSRSDPDTGEVYNYVVTAWHVVRNIVESVPEDTITAKLYQTAAPLEVAAHLVAKNSSIDAAVLRLRTEVVFEHVARVLPPADAGSIAVWDSIYTVGCPLGHDPIPTQGEIVDLHDPYRGADYWMINAPAYSGNSGGGVFLAKDRQLVGVFSKIYTKHSVIVPHMGLMTPVPAIHEWLGREGLGHILRGAAPEPALASLAGASGER